MYIYIKEESKIIFKKLCFIELLVCFLVLFIFLWPSGLSIASWLTYSRLRSSLSVLWWCFRWYLQYMTLRRLSWRSTELGHPNLHSIEEMRRQGEKFHEFIRWECKSIDVKGISWSLRRRILSVSWSPCRAGRGRRSRSLPPLRWLTVS